MGLAGMFRRNEPPAHISGGGGEDTPRQDGGPSPAELEKSGIDSEAKVKLFTPRIFAMIMIVSMGGLIVRRFQGNAVCDCNVYAGDERWSARPYA